jgi:hypothetical protein
MQTHPSTADSENMVHPQGGQYTLSYKAGNYIRHLGPGRFPRILLGD